MHSNDQSLLIEIKLLKKRHLLRGIQRLQLLAVVIVFLTILVAYFGTHTPTSVFISFLSFLVVQVFATREYSYVAQLTRRVKLLSGGPYFSTKQSKISWTIPAGVAVRDGFFAMLIFFDVSWLSHAYLYPSPANSYHQFLQQLAIGPISGQAFVIFTVLLWVSYTYLFVIGALYADELNSVDNPNNLLRIDKDAAIAREVWIKVDTCNQEEIFLQGEHFRNPGRQPLILWPGFYQNGYVYDLSDEASLARYLWENGFDIWIIHPRGTAESDNRREKTSLDDFASADIPAAVSYVMAKTGKRPVFVGHSQGGISAIISLLGTCKPTAQEVCLSDQAADERQQALKGLVVMGSFLNFSFSKPSWLKNFVQEGICFKLRNTKRRLLSSNTLLKVTSRFAYIGTPFSFVLRRRLLQSRTARVLLFPLSGILNFISLLKLWEFLYHIPNVSRTNRKRLFYKTMDGTFSPILQQFHSAVETEAMCSVNKNVNYSAQYGRLKLPVSVVAMEFDSLADPVMMKAQMFDAISSNEKFFTLWKGVGHEDHFTDTAYFPQVLAAIKLVC